MDIFHQKSVRFDGSGVALTCSFFEHPDGSNCAFILVPGIGGTQTQVLPALPLFGSRVVTCQRTNPGVPATLNESSARSAKGEAR